MAAVKAKTAKSQSDGASARARFVAACLLNAGRAKEAEEALRPEAGAEVKHSLALACARQGKLEEAVAAFQEILEKNPGDAAARQAAVTLLHRQAVRKINAKDWAGAGSALGDVLKLDPTNGDVQELLSRIENVLPVALLKAGKRQEAAEAWEKAQRQRPENGKLAHSLALLNYHWALALESEGKGKAADALWHKAIANWVLVRYNDDFWAGWAKQRRAVYPISGEALAALRGSWTADLEKKFRQWTEESETSRRKDAERRRDLEMCYWLERITASALHELRRIPCPFCKTLTVPVPDDEGRPACEGPGCRKPIPQYRPAHPLPVAGPIFLKQQGAEAEAQDVTAKAAQLPNGGTLSDSVKELFKGTIPPFLKTNADVLRLCLSPWGFAFALVVHSRLEDAVAALEKQLPGKGKDAPADAALLMLHACLERGKQLATAIPQLPPDPNKEKSKAYVAAVKEALEAWKKAAPYRKANKELSDQLGERIENLGIRGGNEFYARGGALAQAEKWARAIELLTHGIEVMEFAIAIEGRQRVKDTVSVLYADRGLYNHKNSETDAGLRRAIEDLEASLRHSAQNARAKELLAQAVDLKGWRLLQPYNNPYAGRPPYNVLREAQQCFRRAKELDPTNADYRQHYDIVTRLMQ